MKKLMFLCLCLSLSLLISCPSSKDTEPKPEAAPKPQAVEAPAAPDPVTNLSGDYVLTETISKKTKLGTQEYTFQTIHTYKLWFSGGQTVYYTVKTDQRIDPPTEGIMLQSKRYDTDVTGTYEIRDGGSLRLVFPPSEEKIPWVRKNVMLLRVRDVNTLELPDNVSLFRKQ